MNSETLAKVVRVFYGKMYRKKPQKALGKALTYWETYVSELDTEHSKTFGSMLYRANPEKGCIWVSQGWCDFTGRPFAEHLGEGWTKFIDASSVTELKELSFIEPNKPIIRIYRARRFDGIFRWVIDIIVSIEGTTDSRGLVADIDEEMQFVMNGDEETRQHLLKAFNPVRIYIG
jgi:PAS domain-containing protein